MRESPSPAVAIILSSTDSCPSDICHQGSRSKVLEIRGFGAADPADKECKDASSRASFLNDYGPGAGTAAAGSARFAIQLVLSVPPPQRPTWFCFSVANTA
jgi:hypothetical protein